MPSPILRPWPRMMKRATAAAYCDLSPARFSQEVIEGRLPAPILLGGEDHWCRETLDNDLLRLTGAPRDWRKDQPGLAA